jgi:hypothetical protein
MLLTMNKTGTLIAIAALILLLVAGYSVLGATDSGMTSQDAPATTAVAETGADTQPTRTVALVQAVSSETVVRGEYTGTYEVFTKQGWEGPEACHMFVVTSGHAGVIAYLKERIEEGNTIHSLTPEGHVRINLPWEEMDEMSRARLRTKEPVTLELVKEVQIGKGAGPCTSFFSFVAIK